MYHHNVDKALEKYFEEMKSMEWVKKAIDVNANDVHVVSEETPANTSDKFTPRYLNDNDVESFRKLPQEQIKARYKSQNETTNEFTLEKYKTSKDNDEVSDISGSETVHMLATRVSTMEDGMADMSSTMERMSSKFDKLMQGLTATGLMGRQSQTKETDNPQALAPGGGA